MAFFMAILLDIRDPSRNMCFNIDFEWRQMYGASVSSYCLKGTSQSFTQSELLGA